MFSSTDLPDPSTNRPQRVSQTPAERGHPTQLSAEQLLAECEIRFLRRSGPGGQHRNKVETAVRLSHRPTGVEAQASERRQQAENRAVALERLRLLLALRVRCDRGSAIPSSLWKRRCIGGRIVVSKDHPDRATLLAEVLDCLALSHWDLVVAAERLACSRTQLVRFLKSEPEAYRRFLGERGVDESEE